VIVQAKAQTPIELLSIDSLRNPELKQGVSFRLVWLLGGHLPKEFRLTTMRHSPVAEVGDDGAMQSPDNQGKQRRGNHAEIRRPVP
jgi:hypothetical protein